MYLAVLCSSRIAQVTGEPLHQLDGAAGILRQVLNDVEVQRIGRVYLHRRQRLFLLLLLQVLQQRLVVLLAFPFQQFFGLLLLYGVVDHVQLFRLLDQLLLLQLRDGLEILHRHQLALMHQLVEVYGLHLVDSISRRPLQRHVADSQHKDQPQ